MSISGVTKTTLITTIVAASFVQLHGAIASTVYGDIPLTSPLTSPITPTPTDTPLTSPVQNPPSTGNNGSNNNNNNSNNNGGNSNNSGGGSSNSSNGGSSACTNESPKSAPYLTSVKKVTKTSVTLTWTKGWGPVNEYVIWYGNTKDASSYTSGTIKGEEQVKTATINGLNPTALYYFKVQPKNGCKSGSFSSTVASNGKAVYVTGYTQNVRFTGKPAATVRSTKTQSPAVTTSKNQNAFETLFKSIFK